MTGRAGMRAALAAAMLALTGFGAAPGLAQEAGAFPGPPALGAIRIAVYNASLSRRGPGMAWRAIKEGRDESASHALSIIRRVRPDAIAVLELDRDEEGLALAALQARLAEAGEGGAGLSYPHVFQAPVNTGIPTGFDIDGDGETGGPGDAQGWGGFPGQYGMAVLSRHPFDAASIRRFQTQLWSDMPGALIAGALPEGAAAIQRLSSKSHWDVPIVLPDGRPLHLLVSHPTPPVFDGPEDRNGRRNHDEILFWLDYVEGRGWMTDDEGRHGALALGARFVILGDLNADPVDGDGRREGIGALLASALVQDPEPRSAGAVEAAAAQGGANRGHAGDPALDTADWPDRPGGPGNLRADYALPDARWEVTGAGVFWPALSEPGAALLGERRGRASDHHLVWVDIR